MKRPVLLFTAIAALSLVAVGTATYVNQPAQVLDRQAEKIQKPVEPQELTAAKPDKAVASKPTERPVFDTVRVEQTGEALVAGNAAPETDVTLKLNGAVVGKAKALTDGSFILIPEKPLAKGAGALTLEMEKDGVVVASEGAVVVDVKRDATPLVARIEPSAPTRVITSTVKSTSSDLELSAVDYDAAGNIVFLGRAKPGQKIRFYVDNRLLREGDADAAGEWRFEGDSAIAAGKHMLRADAIDAKGQVVSRVELPFLREDSSKLANVATQKPNGLPKQTDADDQAVHTATTGVEDAGRQIVIQPGNNLWRLSRQVYGKGRMYTVIYEANRSQVKNPNKIYPGQILTAPKTPN
jgi:nucleoid-associated protein YgaU